MVRSSNIICSVQLSSTLRSQDRGGGLNAVAALWVVGIGSVYDSLEVGQHTLVYTLNTPLGDSHFTYNITVVP